MIKKIKIKKQWLKNKHLICLYVRVQVIGFKIQPDNKSVKTKTNYCSATADRSQNPVAGTSLLRQVGWETPVRASRDDITTTGEKAAAEERI